MELYTAFALLILLLVSALFWARTMMKPKCLCKRSTCRGAECVRHSVRRKA